MSFASRKEFLAFFIAPFKGRGSKRLIFIFFLINGVVLFNAILHDPIANYDGHEHAQYIETLAKEHRLPDVEDSEEFFSPPLPYLLPALVQAFSHSSFWGAAKVGQLFNVLLSIGVTFTLLKICDQLSPKGGDLKLLVLGMLGLMPVYYKTFAMVRGEPFVAFFTILSIYLALKILISEVISPDEPGSPGKKNIYLLLLGICLGLVILSRQWGFFLFPAFAIYIGLLKFKTSWGQWGLLITRGLFILLIVFVVGGWFYLSLLGRYGTVTAFNRSSHARFSFANQPLEFYFSLALDDLFTAPIRNSFPNQFIPIFYSEFWGDYWGYFIVAGRDTRSNDLLVGSIQQYSESPEEFPSWYVTNKFDIAPYLGRVNLVALLPTGIILAGIGFGLLNLWRFFYQFPTDTRLGNVLLTLIILSTLLGYGWFLIQYPNPGNGDTIKASYMLHLYPCLALLSGQILQKIKAYSLRTGQITFFLLSVVYLHNLPVMFTRFIPWNLLAYYPPFRWFITLLPWQ